MPFLANAPSDDHPFPRWVRAVDPFSAAAADNPLFMAFVELRRSRNRRRSRVLPLLEELTRILTGLAGCVAGLLAVLIIVVEYGFGGCIVATIAGFALAGAFSRFHSRYPKLLRRIPDQLADAVLRQPPEPLLSDLCMLPLRSYQLGEALVLERCLLRAVPTTQAFVALSCTTVLLAALPTFGDTAQRLAMAGLTVLASMATAPLVYFVVAGSVAARLSLESFAASSDSIFETSVNHGLSLLQGLIDTARALLAGMGILLLAIALGWLVAVALHGIGAALMRPVVWPDAFDPSPGWLFLAVFAVESLFLGRVVRAMAVQPSGFWQQDANEAASMAGRAARSFLGHQFD